MRQAKGAQIQAEAEQIYVDIKNSYLIKTEGDELGREHLKNMVATMENKDGDLLELSESEFITLHKMLSESSPGAYSDVLHKRTRNNNKHPEAIKVENVLRKLKEYDNYLYLSLIHI